MVIFVLFKMAATAISDFQNFNFSTVRTVKRVELHHYWSKLRKSLILTYLHLSGTPVGGDPVEIFKIPLVSKKQNQVWLS